MAKIDLKKRFKELYKARKSIREVDAGTGRYLAVKSAGTPGGEEFQSAVEKLYSVAYTLKFACKAEGFDFIVSGLEALYFDDPEQTPMDQWSWQLMIRIPEEVDEKQTRAAKESVAKRKGIDTGDLEDLELNEGRSLQLLHIGPYDEVGSTYEEMKNHIIDQGLEVSGPPHEVYLNDPRRNPPEKLKTIVRIPVN